MEVKRRSYSCLHCNKLFYVPTKQVYRAGGIKCIRCGGPGEETDSSLRRRLGKTKKQIAAALQSNARFEHKAFECQFCHKPFRSEVGLKLHLEDSHNHYEDAE